ncbi:ribonuclease E inhibitor RraB [Lysinibacillus sp. NPDC092081]|uniref:ribonuclease E inhibitor RraB n=1 Tax=Lysinibacillus sp. NPDC092081 TaxID=3364131 RepID=UPI003815FB5B
MFPSDEDGQILKMLYDEGIDFNLEHNIDFFIACPSEKDAINIINDLSKKEFSCEAFYDEESQEWSSIVYISAKLQYNTIVEIQSILNKIALPHGGYSDGWGVMVD